MSSSGVLTADQPESRRSHAHALAVKRFRRGLRSLGDLAAEHQADQREGVDDSLSTPTRASRLA